MVEPRGEFPLLDQLRYLDTASLGLTPCSVATQVSTFAADLARRGSARSDRVDPDELLGATITAARAALGIDGGGTHVVSSAIGAVRTALAHLPHDTSGQVLVLADDYPELLAVVADHAARRGLTLRVVTPAAGYDETRALAEAMDDDVRLVALAHTHWVTGAVRDPQALTGHGAWVVLDVSQSLGVVGADLDGVDLVVGAGYKWLGAPTGSAIAHLSDHLLETLAGHPHAPDPVAPTSLSFPAVLGLKACLEWWAQRPGLAGRAVEHARSIRAALESHGLRLAGAPEQPQASGILTVSTAAPAGAVRDRLRAHGVLTAERLGGLRLSPHPALAPGEVDATLDALLCAITSTETRLR